jgi:hypothetical protein
MRDGRRRYYRAVNRAPIAPLPPWLAEALTPTVRPPTAEVRISPAQVTPHVRAAIEGETERVATATVGTRHHTLISAAAKLGGLAGAGQLSEHEAHLALESAADWPTSTPASTSSATSAPGWRSEWPALAGSNTTSGPNDAGNASSAGGDTSM